MKYIMANTIAWLNELKKIIFFLFHLSAMLDMNIPKKVIIILTINIYPDKTVEFVRIYTSCIKATSSTISPIAEIISELIK